MVEGEETGYVCQCLCSAQTVSVSLEFFGRGGTNLLYSSTVSSSAASTSGQFPPAHVIEVPGELKLAEQYAADAY